jgi:hypothetical protein
MNLVDMDTDTTETAKPSSNGRPNVWDRMFLLLLLAVLLLVSWVGVLAYQEGQKTEITKRQGEAWMEWLANASAKRFDADFSPATCTGGSPNSWAGCVASLQQPGAALSAMINPFSGQPLSMVSRCDVADRSLAGGLLIEKLIPTPPGSPIPLVNANMQEHDSIETKLQIRVTMCDKGSSPIKIGEIEF